MMSAEIVDQTSALPLDHAALLAKTASLIATTLDLGETVRALGSLFIPEIADWCSIDVLDERGSLDRVFAARSELPGVAPFPESIMRTAPSPNGGSPIWTVIDSGTPLLRESSAMNMPSAARSAEHAVMLAALPPYSFMAVPLTVRGRTIGTAFAARLVTRGSFTPDDLSAFSIVAQQAAYAIDNARLFDRVQSQLRELRQTEAKLVEKEQRLSLIFDTVSDAMMLDRVEEDGHYRCVEVNREYEALTGFRREDVVGKRLEEFLPPHLVELAKKRNATAIAGGNVVTIGPERTALPDGSCIAITTVTPIIDAGRCSHLLVVTRDVTQMEASRQALQESEERYRLLFSACPVPMWLYDPERFEFIEVSNSAVAHYGYSRDEFLAMSVRELHLPEDVAGLEQRVRDSRDGGLLQSESRHRRKDGSLIQVQVYSHQVGFRGRAVRVVFSVDVTARRRLHDQLMQSQKMEAVGRLAGGIAHDFNNILTAILGFAELAAQQLTSQDAIRSEINEITRAAQRASTLTRQLLAYSRKQVLQPKVTDLNDVIRDLSRMLLRLIGEDVRLETRLAGELPPVIVDPGQFEQVLINLVVNARDAMPAGGRLTITTSTERRSLGDGGPVEAVAVVRVRDTGHGMDAATHARLFEPFFTTKEVGRGTGLGLATVYGIVRQSGGIIEVESNPGAGSTFTVSLPCAPAGFERDALVAPDRPTATRGETVLVVEDDHQLRRLVSAMLGRAGYEVLAAGSGAEALQLAAAWSGPLELLLTDVIMPGMSGPQLASRLTERHPGLRTLFMSGYTADVIPDHGIRDGEVELLMKPFTSDVLVRRVRAVLGRN